MQNRYCHRTQGQKSFASKDIMDTLENENWVEDSYSIYFHSEIDKPSGGMSSIPNRCGTLASEILNTLKDNLFSRKIQRTNSTSFPQKQSWKKTIVWGIDDISVFVQYGTPKWKPNSDWLQLENHTLKWTEVAGYSPLNRLLSESICLEDALPCR